ncbi:MAG: SDR family NAD(P)-dependent oxidoreductase [Deinococcus-Thermus bacterium]|jgi:NAD(P)-dependent dehydrogenase (short-subunit alcohol dehydrogenase family)|nr:SDR family NAD(P)-dependent oxidoreductase [Deinococcota bacterium]
MNDSTSKPDPTPSERGAPRPPRHAVLSGAGGGVGSRIARTFADHGCRLVLPARSGLDELRRAFPDARVVEADLGDPEACRRVAEAAQEAFGGVDAVVNVAGGFGMHSALELTPEDLETQLTINLRTAVNLTGALLPSLVERGHGAVLGVSAGAAGRGGRRMTAYAASKAALEGYLRSVRAEVEPDGVGVSLLIPEGAVDTPANRHAMPDADPSAWVAPRALADAAWFLASRPPGGHVPELRVGA